MEEFKKSLLDIKLGAEQALKTLRAPELEATIKTLEEQLGAPEVWQNPEEAQNKSKHMARLRSKLEPWQKLLSDAKETLELMSIGDETMAAELTTQAERLQNEYIKLKRELQLSGQFDDHDAILRLSAGAGGTDAQDWTEMLQRMYLRWASGAGMKAEVIEQSSGEEAGIKSAAVSISGPYAFGKLKGEHGVHRLVRLSPFNSDNLRQTSFAQVEVLPQIDAPDEVEVDDKDLKIDVYRAGGHGGQSVNTTDSAVRVTHVPTGIVVAIQNERSQLQNKETALKILRSKLAQLQLEQHIEKISELKGPNQEAAWGNQIRNYVLHPYKQVKDVRTRYETSNAEDVLDGNLDGFIEAYLEYNSK
jgi:peptide chain release factor 2